MICRLFCVLAALAVHALAYAVVSQDSGNSVKRFFVGRNEFTHSPYALYRLPTADPQGSAAGSQPKLIRCRPNLSLTGAVVEVHPRV